VPCLNEKKGTVYSNEKVLVDTFDTSRDDALTIQKKLLRLSSKKTDEEWVKLHSWMKSYRSSNRLTISGFSKLFDIPMSSEYTQYMSSGGEKRLVSNKSGTQGKILRELLKKAQVLSSTTNISIMSTIKRKPIDLTLDILAEHNLNGLGISGYNTTV
jgi:hypothetical protein